MKWIYENHEWFLSGLGIGIATLVFYIIRVMIAYFFSKEDYGDAVKIDKDSVSMIVFLLAALLLFILNPSKESHFDIISHYAKSFNEAESKFTYRNSLFFSQVYYDVNYSCPDGLIIEMSEERLRVLCDPPESVVYNFDQNKALTFGVLGVVFELDFLRYLVRIDEI